jgi:hypothetical protein
MRRHSEGRMTDTGLQKVAFFLLLGLIVYVAASGGGV